MLNTLVSLEQEILFLEECAARLCVLAGDHEDGHVRHRLMQVVERLNAAIMDAQGLAGELNATPARTR